MKTKARRGGRCERLCLDPGKEKALADAVYRLITRDDRRRPLIEVERELAGKLGTTISAIRGCIRGEVASGRLAYCQELGATLVGKAYCFPIHLTNRILLVPPNIRKPSNPNAIQIILQSGAAFGDGRHPSTRTALFLLDRLASQPKPNEAIGNSGFSADIGTGSGILAIAAALLFPVSVMAIDNDPCARSEAKSNVALNGLKDVSL